MISKKTLRNLSKSQTDLGGVSQKKLLEAMENQDESLVPDDPISQLVYYVGIMDTKDEAESYMNYALDQLKRAYNILKD